MMMLLLALAGAAPDAASTDRFDHKSYQRGDAEVEIRASDRYLLVRKSPAFSVASVERILLNKGADHGVAGLLDLRDGLVELDFGRAMGRSALLILAGALRQAELIEAYFPVWTRGIDGRGHVDERVVLRFAPGRSAAVLKGHGLEVAQRYETLPNILSVRAIDGSTDAVALARRLNGSDDFVWAEPDWLFMPKPLWDPQDPQFSNSWHQRSGRRGGLNMQAAWDVTRGEGVTVAVIDTGTQQDHPDLEVAAGYDLISGDRDASPECSRSPDGRGRAGSCPAQRPYRESHGTAVSGLIAARSNERGTVGICPDCRLLTIRMVGGSQRRVTHAAGLRWIMTQDAAVVNNSWGPSVARYFPMGLAEEETITSLAQEGRGGLGTMLLYAAGNDSLQDAASNPYSTHPDTVTVSASSAKDDFACYSNYGPTVDIAAPSRGCFNGEPGLRTTDISGGEGYADGDVYNEMGGTSGACPVASGVAALIFAANPQLTARQALLVLQASAVKIRADQNDWPRRLGVDLETLFEYDERGHSVGFGYGRVDASAAVTMAQSFTLLGACNEDCSACVDEQCTQSCEADIDCPGRAICRQGEQGSYCAWPEPDAARVGAECTDDCETCVNSYGQDQQLRRLCSASCETSDDCPGGWICSALSEQGKVCVPGYRGCGSPWGEARCDGEIRVLDARTRAFCSCPCYPGEAGPQGGYCPEGFHCANSNCRCTREAHGRCVEVTCEEAVGRGNYQPACYPDLTEEPPCETDDVCGTGRICVENVCREDPYHCTACAACQSHSDCGDGNWCVPVDGRNVCLVSCGVGGACPGDSICRAIDANGRRRSFCLNDPATTSDAVCPADYTCRAAEGRCRVPADCPTRDHWCDDDGECRLDDPEPAPEPAAPAPTPVEPTDNAVAGCACGLGGGVDLSVLLLLGVAMRRRRLGGSRRAR